MNPVKGGNPPKDRIDKEIIEDRGLRGLAQSWVKWFVLLRTLKIVNMRAV